MKCVFKSSAVNGRSFKVMKDNDWDEYVVKFYTCNGYAPQANYHASDKEDAVNTGIVFQMSVPSDFV